MTKEQSSSIDVLVDTIRFYPVRGLIEVVRGRNGQDEFISLGGGFWFAPFSPPSDSGFVYFECCGMEFFLTVEGDSSISIDTAKEIAENHADYLSEMVVLEVL